MKSSKTMSWHFRVTKKNRIAFFGVTPSQTLLLAALLAKFLKPSDTVLLFGEIGSGKTFFTRGVIQKMMQCQNVMMEEIPSPTFTIVQIYDTLSPSVWHLDLYRLENQQDLLQLGFEDTIQNDIYFIEWPEKLGAFIPKRNISIKFEYCGSKYESRNICIEFHGSNWRHIREEFFKFKK